MNAQPQIPATNPSTQSTPSAATASVATPTTPTLTPGERLAERVQTIDHAVQVVEHWVERAELFKTLLNDGVLAQVDVPNSQGAGTIPLHASTIFDPDKFKSIDLQGVDASLIHFVDASGTARPLAKFVLALTPEKAKEFFQGTVYDEHTRFSAHDDQNTEVHKFLKAISSDYNGNSTLTEIKPLVEPASIRCATLLSLAAATETAATPAGAAPSGAALPTTPVAPAVGVKQISAPSDPSLAANSTGNGTAGAAAPSASVATPTTGPSAAPTPPSFVIGDPSVANALNGSGKTNGTFKQVMDDLASHGDESAQVQWFIRQRTGERLNLIKSLADIVAAQGSTSDEKTAAEDKAVALVKGSLREARTSLVADVFIVRAPSNVSTNPASAGSGAAAAGSPPERLLMGLPRLFESLCWARPPSESGWARPPSESGDDGVDLLEWPPEFDEAIQEFARNAGFRRITESDLSNTGNPERAIPTGDAEKDAAARHEQY